MNHFPPYTTAIPVYRPNFETQDTLAYRQRDQHSRHELAPAVQYFSPLVQQWLKTVEAKQEQGQQQDQPRHSPEQTQYQYIQDSNGFLYLIDKYTMKIIHVNGLDKLNSENEQETTLN